MELLCLSVKLSRVLCCWSLLVCGCSDCTYVCVCVCVFGIRINVNSSKIHDFQIFTSAAKIIIYTTESGPHDDKLRSHTNPTRSLTEMFSDLHFLDVSTPSPFLCAWFTAYSKVQGGHDGALLLEVNDFVLTFCDLASAARWGFFLRYVTSSQSASAIASTTQCDFAEIFRWYISATCMWCNPFCWLSAACSSPK